MSYGDMDMLENEYKYYDGAWMGLRAGIAIGMILGFVLCAVIVMVKNNEGRYDRNTGRGPTEEITGVLGETG